MNKRKIEYKSNNNNKIKKIKTETENVNLTEEQKKVVDIVLKEKYNVAVTASTSIVALNINGITIHSYSNIGIMNKSKDDIINKIRGDKRRSYKLYVFLSEIWNRTFQQHILLKQVIRQSDEDLICEKIIDYFTQNDSKLKCNLCEEIIYIRNSEALIRHFRNKHDGVIKKYDDKYEPMMLFSDKKAAKSYNYNLLHSLKGKGILKFYSNNWSVAKDKEKNFDLPSYKQLIEYLDKNVLAEKLLYLKVGMKVISIFNDKNNKGIVNGIFSVIVGFRSKIHKKIYGMDESKILDFITTQDLDPVVKFDNIENEIILKWEKV
ncbi:17199_t:CDS:2 [Dentiscutata heterogama]|uniref:17199_t:CDS:1 n=1 Tax=Dentiscutata heterogama TaxID=1316150 RepID=A0ACA9KTC6_9GLOM|nr:17199_t:CDS:2 [Dentiscutata heterogama]